MSDRIAAEIVIGGKLKRANLDEFLKAVKDQGVSLEWGDKFFEPTGEKDLLDGVSGEVLVLRDDQAPWGEFEDLEKACRETGLSYDRSAEARYEFDGEVVRWRDGMDEPRRFCAGQEGGVHVPAVQIEVEFGGNFEKIETLPKNEVVRKLRVLCGEDIPHMEPFEIVD